MTQPDFVPVQASERVRAAERLPVPHEWRAQRPADISTVHQPSGKKMGSPGPDQGYGLKLARHFADKLNLQEGEHAEDAIAGCLAVALKRASLFGRAPVTYDLELAYTLWGFLGDAPQDLLDHRRPMFEAASHHYEDQRAIADAVPEQTLRSAPSLVANQISNWRQLLNLTN